jgi:hypothetical protein
MVVESLIVAIIALCEQGIEWIKEQHRQRETLMKSVIEPLQHAFEEMYHDHLATFARVGEMISDPTVSPEMIVGQVNVRILFEAGTIEHLGFLTHLDESDEWRKIPKGEIGVLFQSYVQSIATCLVSPTDYLGRFQVEYYEALSDVVNNLTRHRDRTAAAQAFRQIVDRFQRFYAIVCADYARLQRACAK